MKELISRNARRRTASVAVVTILAMLVAPFCSSLCATSQGCSAGAAIEGSDGGDCHHGAAASGTDGLRTGFFAATTCGSSELPAATVSSSKSWDELQRTRSVAPQLYVVATAKPFPSSPCTSRARWRESCGHVGTNDRVTRTTVLRI